MILKFDATISYWANRLLPHRHFCALKNALNIWQRIKISKSNAKATSSRPLSRCKIQVRAKKKKEKRLKGACKIKESDEVWRKIIRKQLKHKPSGRVAGVRQCDTLLPAVAATTNLHCFFFFFYLFFSRN